MYLLKVTREDHRENPTEPDYFGPFPNEDRARRYGEDCNGTFEILPLIVPNCVQVKLVY